MYKKLTFPIVIIILGAIFIIFYADDEPISSGNTDGLQNDMSLAAKIPTKRYSLSGKVILSDGDSLKFGSNSKRARLFAIDSPELAQTCQRKGRVWKCGLQAKSALKKIINGQKITCVGDEKDKYGRLIATCYVKLESAEAQNYINLNAWMVANGWAVAYTYYSKLYVEQEKYAKQKSLGIWQGTFLEPFKWRQKNSRN